MDAPIVAQHQSKLNVFSAITFGIDILAGEPSLSRDEIAERSEKETNYRARE